MRKVNSEIKAKESHKDDKMTHREAINMESASDALRSSNILIEKLRNKINELNKKKESNNNSSRKKYVNEVHRHLNLPHHQKIRVVLNPRVQSIQIIQRVTSIPLILNRKMTSYTNQNGN